MIRTQQAWAGRVKGVTVTIRQASEADLAALGAFFAALSPRTRYLRFFAPVQPTAAMLRRLSGSMASTRRTDGIISHRATGNHASTPGIERSGDPGGSSSHIGGTADGGNTSGIDVLVAVGEGAIVGHAMAADVPGPSGTRRSDIGVVVADCWQGKGVGAALMRALIARAQARGVTLLTLDVLPANSRVFGMIAGHWPAAATSQNADCVTIGVRLLAAAAAPEAPAAPDAPAAPAARAVPAAPAVPATPAAQAATRYDDAFSSTGVRVPAVPALPSVQAAIRRDDALPSTRARVPAIA